MRSTEGFVATLRRALVTVAGAIGWVNARVFLSLIFILVVTPVAFVRRLTRVLRKRVRPDSYFRPVARRERDHFDHPY